MTANPTGRHERAAFELLVQCARLPPDRIDERETQRLLSLTTTSTLLRLGAYHGMLGLVYEQLYGSRLLDGDLASVLRRHYAKAALHHLRALRELEILSATLAGLGRWATVKGPVAVEALYGGRAGRRPYFDIDLLVSPRDFPDAVSAIEEMGGQLQDRNWRMLRRDLRGEVLFRLASGLFVDLHWNVINMYRGPMSVDTAEMLERTSLVSAGRVRIPALDSTDAVLHLALHAAVSGGDRLLWLKDIERASQLLTVDWDAVVARARHWKIAAPVGLILDRTREVLHAPIPASVAPALINSATRRLIALVDLASPWQFGMGRLTAPTRVLSRGVGHGVVRGVAWVVWRSVRNLDPKQAWRSSAFRENGDVSDWRAYLQRVRALGGRNVDDGGA